MKQALWKNILSFLTEIHIESAPSEINPHLYVSLRNARYQLCTANAIYSYADLYDNFYKVFKQIPFEKYAFQKVLILGFGLGSIPWMLEKNFKQAFNYTAVEVDESVVYLANKYVLDELESPIQLICTNAQAFVAQWQERFDLICMDIFLDDIIPDSFQTTAFLEQLQSLLTKEGLLLYNCLAANKDDRAKTKTFFETSFSTVFPKANYLDVTSNWILLNHPL